MPLSLLRFVIFAAAKLKDLPEVCYYADHRVLVNLEEATNYWLNTYKSKN